MRTKLVFGVPLSAMLALISIPVSSVARDALTDSVDVPIPTTRNEVENSIAVSPLNSKVLLVSNIAINPIAGVTSWISTDAGKTWLTSDSLLLSPSYADPAVAVGRSGGTYGRFFVNHIDTSTDREVGIHYKDSTGGTSWTHAEIDDGKISGNATDKNHVAVNNNTSGQFQNYIVSAWSDNIPEIYAGVQASFSTNNGASWNAAVISASQSLHEKRNVNVQWGRPDSSKVFAVWSRAGSGDPISKLFFNSSADGGETWLPTNGVEIASVSGFDSLAGKTSSYSWSGGGSPSMAIDMNDGNIYVAYATKPGSTADVEVIKSTNNGISSLVPVLSLRFAEARSLRFEIKESVHAAA